MNKILLNDKEMIPSKVVCIGRNYVDHIKELNNEIETFLLKSKNEKWLTNSAIIKKLTTELTTNQIELKRIERLKDDRNIVECENIIQDNEDYLAELSKIKLYNNKIIEIQNDSLKSNCVSRNCENLKYNDFISRLKDD